MDTRRFNEIAMNVLVWEDSWEQISWNLLRAYNNGELTQEAFDNEIKSAIKDYYDCRYYGDDGEEEFLEDLEENISGIDDELAEFAHIMASSK